MRTWQHPDLENDILFRIVFLRNEKYIRWLLRNEARLSTLCNQFSVHCDRSHVRCIWMYLAISRQLSFFTSCLTVTQPSFSTSYIWPWTCDRVFLLHMFDHGRPVIFFHCTCLTMKRPTVLSYCNIWPWACDCLFLFRMSNHRPPIIFFYCICLTMSDRPFFLLFIYFLMSECFSNSNSALYYTLKPCLPYRKPMNRTLSFWTIALVLSPPRGIDCCSPHRITAIYILYSGI